MIHVIKWLCRQWFINDQYWIKLKTKPLKSKHTVKCVNNSA